MFHFKFNNYGKIPLTSLVSALSSREDNMPGYYETENASIFVLSKDFLMIRTPLAGITFPPEAFDGLSRKVQRRTFLKELRKLSVLPIGLDLFVKDSDSTTDVINLFRKCYFKLSRKDYLLKIQNSKRNSFLGKDSRVMFYDNKPFCRVLINLSEDLSALGFLRNSDIFIESSEEEASRILSSDIDIGFIPQGIVTALYNSSLQNWGSLNFLPVYLQYVNRSAKMTFMVYTDAFKVYDGEVVKVSLPEKDSPEIFQIPMSKMEIYKNNLR